MSLNCERCVMAKSHKHSNLPNLTRSTSPFSSLNSDVWGPALDFAIHNFSYCVLFVDDFTRMSWVYFLKHKSEVFSVFVTFYNMLHTQLYATPQILWVDNGGEFVNLALKEFLSNHGMIHQTSCPNTPQLNGITERKNRTLLEISWGLLIESKSPAYFWPEAIATATYLTNRLPSKPLNYKTPLATLGSFVSLPSSHSLPPRIFGCDVFIHHPKHNRTKLEPRAVKCVFLGYGVN